MCQRTVLKSCNLSPYTCIAGRRRYDRVLFLAVGTSATDTIEELEVTERSRTELDLNQEVAVIDGVGDDDFTILVPGHPSRHPDFRIEVTGRTHMKLDALRQILLTRLGIGLPSSVMSIEIKRGMDVFHFDGNLTTLLPLVAGNYEFSPDQVRAAFGEEL